MTIMAQVALVDILGNRSFDEPPEVQRIKQYVLRHFQADVAVTVRPSQIVIGVRNSALAGALRMQMHNMKEECQIEKKLVIRISA